MNGQEIIYRRTAEPVASDEHPGPPDEQPTAFETAPSPENPAPEDSRDVRAC